MPRSTPKTRIRQRTPRHRAKSDPEALRVGQKIDRLRREQGFTFDAFVEEIGLGRGYLSELSRGLVVPSMTALSTIAKGLGVTVADLVVGDTARERLFESTRGWPERQILDLLATVDQGGRPAR